MSAQKKKGASGKYMGRKLVAAILSFSLLLSACGDKERERNRDGREEEETSISENAITQDVPVVERPGSTEPVMPEVPELSEDIFTDYAADADYYVCHEDWNRRVILIDLGEEREFGFIYLDWNADECGAVTSYRIETYDGGEDEPPETEYHGGLVPQRKYVTIYSGEAAPYPTTEKIALDTKTSRYIRIDVEGADTVPEIRVLAADPWEEVYDIIVPWVSDGKLVFLGVPEWLSVKEINCNPYAVIDEDGYVQDILEDMDVLAGCTLSYDGWKTESPDYAITIRSQYSEANVGTQDGGAASGKGASEEVAAEASDGTVSDSVNPCPQVIPALQEWRGDTGVLGINANARICVGGGLEEVAETLADDIEALTGWRPEILEYEEAGAGDIVLGFCDESSLGEEGYRLKVSDRVEIRGYKGQGVFWGTRTLLQMMVAGGDNDTEGMRMQAHLDADEILLPCGEARDYPAYPVRGFELDVARNSVSMHMLREMAKNLAWYKINEFTIHLNDNALLAYSDLKNDPIGVYNAYSAFRLESGIYGGYGPLTSRDLYYTQAEFTEFVGEAAGYGVKIIPEIDTPAHSLSITSIYRYNGLKYSPEAADMLDLSQDSTIDIVKQIWNNTLPAFAECDTVHIGGDEYYGDTDDYLRFENIMIDYLNEQDKCVRLWGSLTGKRGSDYVQPRDAMELILWNTDWAQPQVMYEEGYQLINADHNSLYLIPGGGYDYADKEMLYEDFAVNRFELEREEGVVTLPAHSHQMRGAQLCMWNDFCDNIDIGISEYDMYVRLDDALPYFASECWSPNRTGTQDEGVDESTEGTSLSAYRSASREDIADTHALIGQAPGSNPYDNYEDLEDIDAEDVTALLGPDYRIEITLTVTGGYGILPLCEAHRGGNDYTVYLRDASGNVGFAREGRVYSFDYAIPAGESVTIAFIGSRDSVKLCVNGNDVQTIGSSGQQAEHATLLFPVSALMKWQDRIELEGDIMLPAANGALVTVSDIKIEL